MVQGEEESLKASTTEAPSKLYTHCLLQASISLPMAAWLSASEGASSLSSHQFIAYQLQIYLPLSPCENMEKQSFSC